MRRIIVIATLLGVLPFVSRVEGSEVLRPCKRSDLIGGWMLVEQSPAPPKVDMHKVMKTYEEKCPKGECPEGVDIDLDPRQFPYQYIEFYEDGHVSLLVETGEILQIAIDEERAQPHKGTFEVEKDGQLIAKSKNCGDSSYGCGGYSTRCRYVMKETSLPDLRANISKGDILLSLYNPEKKKNVLQLFRRYASDQKSK